MYGQPQVLAPMIYKNKLALANVGSQPSLNIYNKIDGTLIKKINHAEDRKFGGERHGVV